VTAQIFVNFLDCESHPFSYGKNREGVKVEGGSEEGRQEVFRNVCWGTHPSFLKGPKREGKKGEGRSVGDFEGTRSCVQMGIYSPSSERKRRGGGRSKRGDDPLSCKQEKTIICS